MPSQPEQQSGTYAASLWRGDLNISGKGHVNSPKDSSLYKLPKHTSFKCSLSQLIKEKRNVLFKAVYKVNKRTVIVHLDDQRLLESKIIAWIVKSIDINLLNL